MLLKLRPEIIGIGSDNMEGEGFSTRIRTFRKSPYQLNLMLNKDIVIVTTGILIQFMSEKGESTIFRYYYPLNPADQNVPFTVSAATDETQSKYTY